MTIYGIYGHFLYNLYINKIVDYIEKWPFMVIFLYNLYVFV